VTLCIENTPSENGRSRLPGAFVDETRLTGLRFNFDVGHAHLRRRPEEERIEKVLSPSPICVVQRPSHDNHGDKDEHLPPYAGTIRLARPP